MITLTTSLIEQTKELMVVGRHIALRVAENIWKIREELYPAKKDHKDFVKFCDEEFGLKSATVSKYESIGDGFYSHGLTPESFKVFDGYKDYEVVYQASRLPLPVEERLSHALTLTRTENKQTKAELDKHEAEFRLVCVHCWLTKESHP